MNAAVAELSQHKLENEYIRGELLPQVPAGLYDLAFIKYEVRTIHSRDPKVVLWFRIVTPGEAHGVVVARYYNGKPAKGGEFKAGPKSDLAREFCDVFGYVPKRWDRWPMPKFKGCVIEGRVHTVTSGRGKRGNERRTIPKPLQYSVIEYLCKLKAGVTATA